MSYFRCSQTHGRHICRNLAMFNEHITYMITQETPNLKFNSQYILLMRRGTF